MSEENEWEQRPADFIYAIWFIHGHSPDTGKELDWMATVWRHEGEEKWRLTYRFRYYVDRGDPFEGKDEKSWWRAGPDFLQKIVYAVEKLYDKQVKLLKSTMHGRTDVGGTASKLREIKPRPPWMHFKEVELE